jgi:hypothetical protein
LNNNKNPQIESLCNIIKRCLLALINNIQIKMIKWIKFYKTGSDEVVTFNLSTQQVESEGQTHAFSDQEDALSKSTNEVFLFWDNIPLGPGLVK